MKALLDTSVLIATGLPALDGELAISAASLAELHFGVMVTADDATRAERLRRLTMLQRSFDALPIDDDVAASYGRLAAAHVGRQPRSRVFDRLIAETRTHTTPACTRATPQTSPASTISSKSSPSDDSPGRVAFRAALILAVAEADGLRRSVT